MKKNFIWVLLLCSVVFLLPSLLGAADRYEFMEGGAGTFLIGATWLDVDDLNSALSASVLNLKTFDGAFVSYGGMGYGIIAGRIVIGGEGHGFGKEVATSTHIQSLNGGYGMFDAGYLVFHRAGFRVFPMIGLGGGVMTLRITERAVLGFDDIMTNTNRESVLDIGGFMLQGALGVDYFLKLGEDQEGVGGLMFGVRAGYTQSFFNSKWRMGPLDIVGGPKAGISGFFIRFSFGGGGYTYPRSSARNI